MRIISPVQREWKMLRENLKVEEKAGNLEEGEESLEEGELESDVEKIKVWPKNTKIKNKIAKMCFPRLLRKI